MAGGAHSPVRREARREQPGVSSRLLGSVAGVTGRHVSALAVLLWCICMAIASSVAPWATTLVVGAACIVLVSGWRQLTRTPQPRAAALVAGAAGVLSAAAVLHTHDLSAATPLLGVSMPLLAAAVLVGTGGGGTGAARQPSPRDGTAPRDGEVQSVGRAPAESLPTGQGPGVAHPDPSARRVDGGRRGDTRAASLRALPSVLALPSAVASLLVAVGGSAWVALAVQDQWSPTLPLACLMAAAVVLGDQFASSFRANSVGALLAGALAGVACMLGLEMLDMGGTSVSSLLPALAATFGPRAAPPLFGVATGIAVALAIIAVDGLLGDHLRRSSHTGALARGSAKFLVAVLPIYALIRIGGI